jgi:tetratricopeptide (TPR) repeat protein
MRFKLSTTRLFILVATFSALASSPAAWSQDPPKKDKASKAVTKALKKVDRQLLSYSPEKAKQLLEPVMEDKDPRVDATMGQILVLEKEYEEGVAKLQTAARKSGDPVILLALGDAQVASGKRGQANSSFQQAVDEAEALLAGDPAEPEARFALGAAQQRLKNYDEAIANLTQAKAKDSGNPRIPFELGLAKMSRGDNQAAFDELTQAIELYSGYAYAYYYRALAANQINRKDITVNDLDRFLALAPEAPEAPKAQRILQAARG